MGGFDGTLTWIGAPGCASPLGGIRCRGFANTTVGTVHDGPPIPFTATHRVTVIGRRRFAGAALFTGCPHPLRCPITLAARADSFSVPVTFTPEHLRGCRRRVTIPAPTSAGPYQVGLTGTGLTPNRPADRVPGFYQLRRDGCLVVTVTAGRRLFQSGQPKPLSITGERTFPRPLSPSGGLPSNGTVLTPGASVSVSISFSPTTTNSYLDELSLISDTGGTVGVGPSVRARQVLRPSWW